MDFRDLLELIFDSQFIGKTESDDLHSRMARRIKWGLYLAAILLLAGFAVIVVFGE